MTDKSTAGNRLVHRRTVLQVAAASAVHAASSLRASEYAEGEGSTI
jgi:hypothetical protein